MSKSKLILGTAEFNPFGYNREKCPTLKEIRKILTCAKEGGINIIDTAESYNCYGVIKQEARGFCIYTKTRDWKVNLDWGDNELRGILYHYGLNEKPIAFPFIHRWVNQGASVYTLDQLPNRVRITQIPFNIQEQQFGVALLSQRTVFVRSVFGRGKLLKKYSIKDCLDFVNEFRPDGIIVGVKTSKELEQILKANK